MTQQRKAAIVTGSSTGIGAACAVELARRGYDIIVNYTRSKDEAWSVVRECIGMGGDGARAVAVQADVADDSDCRRLAGVALENFGRIDALVNSAGTTKLVPHHHLDGLDASDFQRIYAVNCIGPFQMVRACREALAATGSGAVVQVSAIGGISGAGSCIAYAASKGALNTMTLSLARALGPQIRVNAVCPGLVESRWMRTLHGDRYDRFKADWEDVAPLAATPSTHDVAMAVAWLATDAAQITGQCIVLDAGHSLGRPSSRPPRA